MAIVATYEFGKGKGIAYVDDSCVVKTKEEVQGIIDRIYKIYEASELAKIKESQKKKEVN